MDSVIAAAIVDGLPLSQVFVMADRDEAHYFQNDLQNLLPDKLVHYFPASYKKPYQLLETENANILQRAEVLSRISEEPGIPQLVVTHPEALFEKVINQKSLVKNTFIIRAGDQLDLPFLLEIFHEYDFERAEFVYEPGQYSVRGGIVDIFSYSYELPFRIELFDDEIESIRIFDPLTQLSVNHLEQASVTPNIQTKLLYEVRQSFFEFLPSNACFWFKDYQLTSEVIGKHFKKSEEIFDEILAVSNYTKVVNSPSDLFLQKKEFIDQLEKRKKIEFGKSATLKDATPISFESQPQTSFNKNFQLFTEELDQFKVEGYQCYLFSDSQVQLNRIRKILDETDPDAAYHEIPIALRAGFIDKHLKIACYTDHQIFDRYHRYYQKKKYSKSKSITLKELRELQVGDYIVHIDYGIGRFSGLEKVNIKGKEQESIRLVYRDNDILYISIHSLHKISKYSGKEGTQPKISKLGTTEWEQKKRKAKKKVKDIAGKLIKLYAKRKLAPGFAFAPDDYMQAELESSFLYTDTPDQASATADVKADMEKPHPMDRLICGDVGFGKTEVAIRAAFKAVANGKQVAILVPTTILAVQHYRTFTERLGKLPCSVDYVNRFRSNKDIKATLAKLASGELDIIIGTHRVVGKDVKFKDLGLLIIDEEQKFGVRVKDKLKEFKLNVDTLTLTATPIPRTLQFSMIGARDLSVIATPPPNRQPVTTELHVYSNELIRDVVSYELSRSGQVFFVHNRINDLEKFANKIMELVPDAKVAYAHGQMDGERLERIMLKFMDGEYDVLVSTNIVESGLDIPNANTIIINRAHMYGLSDLHQMRGRVGRSNRKAYCYLISQPKDTLTPEARKRLSALEEFTDLGSGFKIAMRDLDIRGAGDLLGGEQSGFINDLGFDVYHKVLNEAIQELKDEEFKEIVQIQEGESKEQQQALQQVDTTIETDFEILIPEDYIEDTSERLNRYIAADNLKNEQELKSYRQNLQDRFGPLPEQVQDLLRTVELRWLCEQAHIEKLVLKNDKLKAYFPKSDNAAYYQSELFAQVLDFARQHAKRCKLNDAKSRAMLVVNEVLSIAEAEKIIRKFTSHRT